MAATTERVTRDRVLETIPEGMRPYVEASNQLGSAEVVLGHDDFFGKSYVNGAWLLPIGIGRAIHILADAAREENVTLQPPIPQDLSDILIQLSDTLRSGMRYQEEIDNARADARVLLRSGLAEAGGLAVRAALANANPWL